MAKSKGDMNWLGMEGEIREILRNPEFRGDGAEDGLSNLYPKHFIWES